MNEHTRKIRRSLVELVKYSGLKPDKVDLDSEVPKWNPNYIEEFTEALPIFDEEKLAYILRGIFERDLVQKLTNSFRIGKDTGDQFSDYNRLVLNRMQKLGLDVDAWTNGKISKKLIVYDSEGNRHEVVIRPINHTADAREHLLLGNPHPVKESCTVARKTNDKVPNVNLDYLLDASVRSITLFSNTLKDSIGYLRLVAAEINDKKPEAILGSSFMVFTDSFKENPVLISGILCFLNLDPDFAGKVGFKGTEVNYAGDLQRLDSTVEQEINNALGLTRGRVKELERKRNLKTITDKEKEILEKLRNSYQQLEKALKSEVYTKKGARKLFMKKIGLDSFEYSSKWKGATYFDIWGGENRCSGKTLDSVDCSKGHNYQGALDLVSKVKKQLKNHSSEV